MAALLVGLAVMSIMMSAALPVWSQQTRREKEEEYLFRAYQYARGVALFQRKYANSFPPSFDVLVEQRMLRKKYKDPLTGQDFNPVYMTPQAANQPGVGGGGAAQPGMMATPGGQPGSAGQAGQSTQASGFTQTSTTGTGAPAGAAGVMGVVSKSKDTSIRAWNGRTRYDQWAVTYQNIRPGKGLPPDLRNAANGLRPGQPGQPGQPGGFGQPGAGGVGQPGGQGGFRPVTPGGQPGAAGSNPFQPRGVGQSPAPGTSPFQPMMPAPPTGRGFTPSPPVQGGATPFSPKGSGS